MEKEICELLEFWKKAKNKDGTIIFSDNNKDFIAKEDYDVLLESNLFISEDERKANICGTKIHKELNCEPFVGDLLNAKYFIFTLNPGVDKEYGKEYANWENKKLRELWKNNLNPTEKVYPFYYINPALEKENILGRIWWKQRLLKKQDSKYIKFNGKKYDFNDVRNELAKKFCDIELCPYHSKNWSSKLTKLISDGKLKSSQLAIQLMKKVIHDENKIVFIRGAKDKGEVYKTLSVFIPELKQDLPNVHYILGRSPYLTAGSQSGKILYENLVKDLKPIK